MRNIQIYLRPLLSEDQASSAVEYAVVLALIVVVCAVAAAGLGEAAYDALWDVAEALE